MRGDDLYVAARAMEHVCKLCLAGMPEYWSACLAVLWALVKAQTVMLAAQSAPLTISIRTC